MFRQFAAISLLVAFAMQVFNRNVIVLHYYTNQTAFAKNCENKTRPQLHCNGKCQMMKKLKEEEKKEQQNPEQKSNHKNEVLSSQSYFTTLAVCNKTGSRFFSPSHQPFLPIGSIASIFHPPAFASAIKS